MTFFHLSAFYFHFLRQRDDAPELIRNNICGSSELTAVEVAISAQFFTVNCKIRGNSTCVINLTFPFLKFNYRTVTI